MKTPKCTIGPKHKWTWIKNVTVSRHDRNGVGMSLRGRYKCECGARKIGDYRRELEKSCPPSN